MELCVQLSCPCRPAFQYKTPASLAAHKKTKLHKSWEMTQENKQDKIRSKDFENEIERLKRRLEHKEEIETELIARIHQLEYELTYWKKSSEGVYL